MIEDIDGMHYTLPFYRAVRPTRESAYDAALMGIAKHLGSEHVGRSMNIERVAGGFACTINMDPPEEADG